MNKQTSSHGFSILEVMVAVMVVASLGLGIYRLQLAELNASRELLVREQMMHQAMLISNQILSHLNATGNTTLNKVGGYNSTLCTTGSCYAETNYSDHSLLYLKNCSLLTCNDSEFADYLLYNWKQGFKNINMPSGNILGVVCLDTTGAPPTLASPNCSGSGKLMVKLIWQAHALDQESQLIGKANYLVLRIPQS
jgi:prepilin-type N-terminal cleavage/methylation domain-containing protein